MSITTGRGTYVANLSAEPRVRAKHQGRWRDATATPLPDDDPMPRLERWRHKRTSELIRKFGTQLLTVRIDLDKPS